MNNTKPVLTTYAEFDVWFLNNDQPQGSRGLSEIDVVQIVGASGQIISNSNIEVTGYGTHGNLSLLTNDVANTGNGCRWSDSNNPTKYLKCFSVKVVDLPSVTSLSDLQEIRIQQEKPKFSVEMTITSKTPFNHDDFDSGISSALLTEVDVYENNAVRTVSPITHPIPTTLNNYRISRVVDTQYGSSASTPNGEIYYFPL